jgi:hypothetical protein
MTLYTCQAIWLKKNLEKLNFKRQWLGNFLWQ